MNQHKGKTKCRVIQSHRYAQIIIVDISEPGLDSYCENISLALEEFLLLHNSLPGAPKLQLLSVFVIGESIECILPIQNIKTNHQKIIQSIQTLRYYHGIPEHSKHEFEGKLSFVLMESFTQLQQMAKYTKPTSSQFDVCVFTCRRHIEKQVARVVKEHDMNLIKKVQIVHIVHAISTDADIGSSAESSGSADSATTEVMCGYVESLFLQHDRLSLEQFFKSWLQDTGSDDLHLIMAFNSFSVKCDLVDTVVNPLHFAGGRNLILETELSVININNSLSAKSRQPGLAVYTLTPKMIVPSAEICESVLFGFPLILKPTTCWKLEWEELEQNQSYFSSLNAYLHKESSAVLMESSSTNTLKSYFFLLPSSSGTMLIKSVATRDIMMPHDAVAISPNCVVSNEVQEEMEKIEVGHSYNPFNFTCGLFTRLPKTTTEASRRPLSSSTSSFTKSSYKDVHTKKRLGNTEFTTDLKASAKRPTKKYVPRFTARTYLSNDKQNENRFNLTSAFTDNEQKRKSLLFEPTSDV